jgi:putative membrane protein
LTERADQRRGRRAGDPRAALTLTSDPGALIMRRAVYLLGAALGSCIALASAQGLPTDPQIAAIVVTANQVDIDAGKLAERKGHAAEVKAFAKRMVTDHTGVNQAAVSLAHELHVTPESNPTSESLKQGGEQNMAALRNLSGRAFDKAYIDHEVAYHQSVLDAMDKVLIPGAQNPQLKALLVKVRPAFVDHLNHAKMIQSSLAGQ